jgi:hypothetical protein
MSGLLKLYSESVSIPKSSFGEHPMPLSPSRKAPSRKPKKPVSRSKKRTKPAASTKTVTATNKSVGPLQKKVKANDLETRSLARRIVRIEASLTQFNHAVVGLQSNVDNLINQRILSILDSLDILRKDHDFRVKDNESRFGPLEDLLKEHKLNQEVKEAEERSRENRSRDGKNHLSSGKLRSVLP